MANIYLHIEIKKREFEAKFFTGLKAALRGHKVLVGYLLPLLRRDLLAPGIFHDKALTPRPKKIASMAAARAAGHHYTSIDEEHGLLRESYDMFANLRYSAETLEQASAVMFWGPHDYGHMKKAYPQFQDKFHMTGNPRADLWRPDFAPVYDVKLPVKKPYILFVSNLGAIFAKHDLVSYLSSMRDGYFTGPEDEKEFWFYKLHAYSTLLGGEYVRAIRRLAIENPGTQIVVRPHPIEVPAKWQKLIGDYQNVVVTHEGSANAWIRNASVMIHNGCTTAIEATKSGTPVLTFAPIDDNNKDYYFPNRLGERVATLDHLLASVRNCLEQTTSKSVQKADLATLAERLADPAGGETSADQMITIWERLAEQGGLQTGNFWKNGAKPRLKSIESFYDVYRYAKYLPLRTFGVKKVPTYPSKFEVFDQESLNELRNRFARYDAAFQRVRVTVIGPRLCSIEA